MLPATEWCSPSNPQGRCSPLPGIAKPMTVSTANLFHALQRAVNVLLAQDKMPKVRDDARIGPETLAAVNRYASPRFANIDELAAAADEVTPLMKGLATTRGSSLPSTSSGLKIAKSGFPWVAALLLGGLGIWMYQADKKKPADERWF